MYQSQTQHSMGTVLFRVERCLCRLDFTPLLVVLLSSATFPLHKSSAVIVEMITSCDAYSKYCQLLNSWFGSQADNSFFFCHAHSLPPKLLQSKYRALYSQRIQFQGNILGFCQWLEQQGCIRKSMQALMDVHSRETEEGPGEELLFRKHCTALTSQTRCLTTTSVSMLVEQFT